MLKFAANLALLFPKAPLLERFQKAADAGFRVVEMWVPFEFALKELAQAREEAGVQLLQFNLDMGDYASGERGLLSHPDQKGRFRAGFELALEYARRLGVRQFNCLAGNRVTDYSKDEQLACMKENLEWVVPHLEANDMVLNIEPLDAFYNPDYLFTRSRELFPLLRELGLPGIGVLYDIFRAQLMEGNLVTTMRENLPLIGHIQIADVPGRHQPGTGEINFRYVLAAIEAMGYDKFVSLEYAPLGSTEESLAWLPVECRVTARADDLQL